MTFNVSLRASACLFAIALATPAFAEETDGTNVTAAVRVRF